MTEAPVGVGAPQICVALDQASLAANVELAEQLAGRAAWFKVGMRLFYEAGADVVRTVQATGAKVFLDLKLHDIPATVAGAMASLAPLEPALVTVHASGGEAMVAAAVDAAPARTKVIAVTVLTSLSSPDLVRMAWPGSPASTVSRLAQVAMSGGAEGMVCSPREVAALRGRFPGATLVVPGIRPAGSARGDQKRVATPADAIRAGASLLVVGRPIRAAADPCAAFDAIAAEVAAAHEARG